MNNVANILMFLSIKLRRSVCFTTPPIGNQMVTTGWREYHLRHPVRISLFWLSCLPLSALSLHGGTVRDGWLLCDFRHGLSTTQRAHSLLCKSCWRLPWFEGRNPRWHCSPFLCCSASWSAKLLYRFHQFRFWWFAWQFLLIHSSHHHCRLGTTEWACRVLTERFYTFQVVQWPERLGFHRSWQKGFVFPYALNFWSLF